MLKGGQAFLDLEEKGDFKGEFRPRMDSHAPNLSNQSKAIRPLNPRDILPLSMPETEQQEGTEFSQLDGENNGSPFIMN